MAAIFDLTRNPFALLGASPRDDSLKLADAKADRIFDSGHNEALLEAAHADLIVEKKRLPHELAWLSDIAPNRARELVSGLATLTLSEALALRLDGAQLSWANLTADLLGRFPSEASFLRRLINLHDDIDWLSIRHAVQEARVVSGFGAVKDASWKVAQSDLVERHASALISAITLTPNGPEMLANILAEHPSAGNPLLEKAISQYDRWSIPHLERISEEIDAQIAALRLGGDPGSQLTSLERSLREWDRLSQPVQLRDQTKGLDEPRSLSLFKRVRDVAIWFANERANPEAARRISEAFASAFSELPTVVAMTSADLETLSGNIAAANAERALLPLNTAADSAMENLHVTARQILAGDFQSGRGRGAVAALSAAFDQLRPTASELPDPNMPWLIVRSVALALNNDINAHDAAKRLVEAIIDTAPPAAKERLEGDLSALRSLVLQADFAQALQRGDLRGARDMIPAMIDASPDERSTLIGARDTLDGRLRSRNLKRVGWGIAAAVLLVVIISENSSRPASTPAPTYQYDTSSSEGVADSAEVSGDSPSGPVESGEEEQPPTMNYAPLTLPQLRFCKFESARLELLQTQVRGSAVSQFNAKVDNYNSRCGSFRYSESDMAVVDAELASSQPRIRSQVAALLSDWRAPEALPSAEPDVGIPSGRVSPLDGLDLQPESETDEQSEAGNESDGN